MNAAMAEESSVWEPVNVTYLSPEWYEARRTGVSASEIASILGLNPGDWVSRYDLWWEKRTGEMSQPENAEMRRGRRLEPMVVEDFAAEHPELRISSSLTVRSTIRPWQAATPDAMAYDGASLVASVEAKTAFSRAEWGEPYTDQVPIHYRCQALWQMDVLGVKVAYIPVWFGTQYAEYVVEYDADDVAVMRDAACKFLDSIAADEPPEVDDSYATTRRLKVAHTSIDPGEVEVPAAVIAQYRAAKRLRDAAEARMRLCENRVRALMGAHDVAVVDGRKVASRSVYDVKARTQEVRAHTVNKLTFSKSQQERNL